MPTHEGTVPPPVRARTPEPKELPTVPLLQPPAPPLLRGIGGDAGFRGGGAADHTVVVGGGLQGVGTSTVAALLALAAAGAGRQVLLVEGEGEGGALSRALGVRAVPRGERETVRVRAGLTLHRGGSTADARLALMDTGAYDLVVVDAGWRMETVVGVCAAGAERTLLVSTAGRASLSATFGLMKAIAYRFPVARFDLVMNQQAESVARRNLEHLQTASLTFLGRSFAHAWAMPDDACLRAGMRGGMLLEDAAADSEVAEAARTMALRIAAEVAGRRVPILDVHTLAGDL
jgi:MinD-like ATPase involved in chromosome partitioning or flagellar assembly